MFYGLMRPKKRSFQFLNEKCYVCVGAAAFAGAPLEPQPAAAFARADYLGNNQLGPRLVEALISWVVGSCRYPGSVAFSQ